MPSQTPKREALDDAEVDGTPAPSDPSSSPSSSPKSIKKRGPTDETAPSTPTKKARKTTSKSPSSAATTVANSTARASTTGWTDAKKAALIDRLITKGAAAEGMANLAKEFEVDGMSLQNALRPNTPSNLRGKAVKAVSQ